MNWSQIKNGIKARLPLSMQFLVEVLVYWRRLCRFNASIGTDRDMGKMQYTLLRENHIIEKGMSMRNTRRGFGQAKVSALIARLRHYYQLYGSQDHAFLNYPLSTIQSYIDYQHRDGVEIAEIERNYRQLCEEVGFEPDQHVMPAGVQMMTDKQLQEQARGDYESLLKSRHSIRYFRDELPSHELLEQALQLASRTPSACNRQAWHTHIYFGEDSHELLRMQGGCTGFHDDIHCSIVVTADMKGFLSHELFQCYVDGGLYAQNLINALHYVGLGAIPLSCGFHDSHLQPIRQRFDIPQNEVMVVIIGVGVLCETTKIAISTRRPISATNIYH